MPISIDDDLARAAGPQVLPSPLAIPGFTMKQYCMPATTMTLPAVGGATCTPVYS